MPNWYTAYKVLLWSSSRRLKDHTSCSGLNSGSVHSRPEGFLTGNFLVSKLKILMWGTHKGQQRKFKGAQKNKFCLRGPKCIFLKLDKFLPPTKVGYLSFLSCLMLLMVTYIKYLCHVQPNCRKSLIILYYFNSIHAFLFSVFPIVGYKMKDVPTRLCSRSGL